MACPSGDRVTAAPSASTSRPRGQAAVAIGRDLAEAMRALAGPPPELGHVDEPVRSDAQVRRPLDVEPLLEVTALGIEQLDPVVLAIGDEHPAIREDADAVRDP